MILEFKKWLEYLDPDDEYDDDGDLYFSIGHGDWHDEEGIAPNFIVWAYINGKVQATDEYGEDDEGNPLNTDYHTHGTKWGHDVTDETYKGRYEPQTGRLSIVKPRKWQQREIPSTVMRQLYKKFGKITQIYEF